MHSILFGNPAQGSIIICLAKNVAALQKFVISTQSTPTFLHIMAKVCRVFVECIATCLHYEVLAAASVSYFRVSNSCSCITKCQNKSCFVCVKSEKYAFLVTTNQTPWVHEMRRSQVTNITTLGEKKPATYINTSFSVSSLLQRWS